MVDTCEFACIKDHASEYIYMYVVHLHASEAFSRVRVGVSHFAGCACQNNYDYS